MGSNPTWGSSLFSLKRRESEPSQLVVLRCLALFDVSQLHNQVLFSLLAVAREFRRLCNAHALWICQLHPFIKSLEFLMLAMSQMKKTGCLKQYNMSLH